MEDKLPGVRLRAFALAPGELNRARMELLCLHASATAHQLRGTQAPHRKHVLGDRRADSAAKTVHRELCEPSQKGGVRVCLHPQRKC